MRTLTSDDVPWVRSIFNKRFSNRYDGDCSEQWLREKVLPHPALYYAARTDDAYLIALLSTNPWTPADFDCHVITVCADLGRVWQTLPLLRACLDWARKRKCVRWNYQSDTSHDIEPLMRRIGAKKLARFQVDLNGLGQ